MDAEASAEAGSIPPASRDGLATFAVRAATLGSKFALILSMARQLPAADVGRYGVFAATILLGVQLLGLEFYVFSLRDLARRPEREWPVLLRQQLAFHARCHLVTACLTLVVVVLGLVPGRLAVWFLAILILEHIGSELYRVLVVAARPVRATWTAFLRSGAWCLVAVAMLWMAPQRTNLESIFGLWLLGLVAGVGLALGSLRHLPWRGVGRSLADQGWIRGGLRVAAPFLLVALSARAMGAVDRYVLLASHGADRVGIYVVLVGMANALQVLLESSVVAVHFPRLLRAAEDPKALAQMLKRFGRALFGATALMVSAGAIGGPVVLHLIGKPAYTSEIATFWILLASVGVTAAGWIVHQGLFARRRDRALVVGSLLGLLVTVVLDVSLIPPWGARGAAWAFLGGVSAAALFKAVVFWGYARRAAARESSGGPA